MQGVLGLRELTRSFWVTLAWGVIRGGGGKVDALLRLPGEIPSQGD